MIAALGLSLVASMNASVAEVLWLTETPPPKTSFAQAEDQASHQHHMHSPAPSAPSAPSPATSNSGKHDHTGMIVLDETPGKDHRAGKQVWLRRGDDIKKSPFTALDEADPDLTVIDQTGKKSLVKAIHENGLFTLKAEMALPVHRTAMPGGLFLMGVAMTLSPCAPLGLVLFSAAMSGGTMSGMLLGLCFGLGAIVVPSVVFGVGMAYVGARLREQLKDWLPRIERLSAWLLVLTGVGSLARW